MKPLLFLELSVIFASSFLLTTQLFYNCLNETHFIAIGSIGIAVASLSVLAGYLPSPTTIALYFLLAMGAFGFFIYNIGIGYIVYDFGGVSRDIFIEKVITGELKKLPKYAERSNDKFGGFEFTCRHESFAYAPGSVERAYEKESCYGPLAFLLLDIPELPHLFNCQADKEGWAVEVKKPGSDKFLCIDKRRQVLINETSIEDMASCR